MSLIDKKYDGTLASIVGYYEDKLVDDPVGTLVFVNQELENQNVMETTGQDEGGLWMR